jgi:hypothetical protein
MIEQWVSLERTVGFVKDVTGASLGPACQTLIAICESGEVRARWTDHYLRTLPAIHKREWIGADIEWSTFRVGKADGSHMAGVDFSADDLNTWAASREISTAPAPATIPPNAKRRSGGRPPDYEWVEIEQLFEKLLRERGDPTNELDQSPGWKSIADAMRVIADHLQKKGKAVPEKTRFYEVLNDVLSDYRSALVPVSGN